MKKARNGFVNNLHYVCLIGVIAAGLITTVGSYAGDDGDTTTTTTLPTADGGDSGD